MMLFQPSKTLIFFIFMLFLQGCTISQRVVRVDATEDINKIYVLKNDKVLMQEFHPELLKQLNDLGFTTVSYSGALPQDATYYLNYTANWMWDMAMNLVYFKAMLYKQGYEAGYSKLIGEVEYDAKSGMANIDKFGHTADKIKPLLQELFANIKKRK